MKVSRFFLALACLVMVLSLQTPRPASSQQIIQVLGPNPIIAGLPVSCGGTITAVAMIPDIAMARPGQILLHPNFFQLPGPVQVFTYAHECGHHVVGVNETAADCYAAQTGRAQGWLTPQGMQLVMMYFQNSRGDWTHAPGPIRIQQMAACYGPVQPQPGPGMPPGGGMPF